MKLSEAILLGSVGSEQGFGAMCAYSNSNRKCALAAALFAKGVIVNDYTVYGEVPSLWPWTDTKVASPISLDDYAYIEPHIYNLIWVLNDIGRWTRPQIAAWVATLEAIYDPTPTEVPSATIETTTSNPISEHITSDTRVECATAR